MPNDRDPAVKDNASAQTAFQSSAGTDNLATNFPLLSSRGFKAFLVAEFNKANSLRGGSAATSDAANASDEWRLCQNLRADVIKKACSQMDFICEMALRGETESAAHANRFLCEILLGTFSQPQELRDYCQSAAASVIREMSSHGLTDNLFACVAICLTREANLKPETKTALLDAFRLHADATGNAENVDCDRLISQVVLEAIELELAVADDVSLSGYLNKLMNLAIRFPLESTPALLETISRSHRLVQVRELAAKTGRAVNGSLCLRWRQARTDYISDLPYRAQRLAQLKSKVDTVNAVNVIFNCFKGRPLESIMDPRAASLKNLLDSKDNTVRMAACWAVVSQGTYCEYTDDFIGAIDTLADVAIHSGCAGLSSDAFHLMIYLHHKYPEFRARIEKASQEASANFVAQHLTAVDDTISEDL